MQYSYNRLRGKIVETYGSQRNFAKALGISSTSLSKKMTCKSGISQDDIEEWAKLLKITDRNEFGEYFFT